MSELTDRQRKVYRKLESWDSAGRKESLSQVAAALDIHYVSLRQNLSLLEKKGYLNLTSQGKGKAPHVELANRENNLVPLLGQITAGGLNAAESEIEGYLRVPGAKGRFALSVNGDSMAGLLLDGDTVIFEQRSAVEGDICAVYVDGQTTLKYLNFEKDCAVLRPHNPDYDPIHVAYDELHIQGVLWAMFRGFALQSLLEENHDLN